MCYRHGIISFDRPCPHCGAAQCNEQKYCTECGERMPYAPPTPEMISAALGDDWPAEDPEDGDGDGEAGFDD